jgi:hypothetical protein
MQEHPMNVPTQITENIDLASKTFVDTNDRVLDTVVSISRRVVETAVEVADRAPSFDLPVELPLADKLPTPAEAGKQYIDFVERAVSMNRDFAARLVAQLPTAAPAKPAAKAAAKPAAKHTAKPAAKRTVKAAAKPAAKTAAKHTAK